MACYESRSRTSLFLVEQPEDQKLGNSVCRKFLIGCARGPSVEDRILLGSSRYVNTRMLKKAGTAPNFAMHAACGFQAFWCANATVPVFQQTTKLSGNWPMYWSTRSDFVIVLRSRCRFARGSDRAARWSIRRWRPTGIDSAPIANSSAEDAARRVAAATSMS